MYAIRNPDPTAGGQFQYEGLNVYSFNTIQDSYGVIFSNCFGSEIIGGRFQNNSLSTGALSTSGVRSNYVSVHIFGGYDPQAYDDAITDTIANTEGMTNNFSLPASGSQHLSWFGEPTNIFPGQVIVGDLGLVASNRVTTNGGFASLKLNTAAPNTITVGASPFTFTCPAQYNVEVTIGGGIVTALSVNGSSVASGLTLTGVSSFDIQTNETLTVTYSSTPTMKWKPL
jgi:hypothetical protein